MSSIRAQLLQLIYNQFEQWLAGQNLALACQPGCAACCTQNVTITAIEGDEIHRYINEKGLSSWLAERLKIDHARRPIAETTNEFAGHCLAGEPGGAVTQEHSDPCPFLADNRCQIYPVRPFSCRSFASLTTCAYGQAAKLPEFYVSAATAAQQLIEHVGQGEYWGNMHDVLLALCDQRENENTAEEIGSTTIVDQARARLRKACPLPGFLIGAEEYETVSPFIIGVFNERIGEKSVEDILNGK